MRKTLIILLVFCFNFSNGQNIQHEPEKLLRYSLVYENMPSFATENNIMKVICFRDTLISSSITFDRKGNVTETVGNENNSVQKTEIKFDSLNREIETKHYKPDGTFSYGYYYEYFGNTKLSFKLKDSLLLSKSTKLDEEKMSIYSHFDTLGNLTFKTIVVYDNDMKSKLELMFNYFNLDREYRYEYIDNKKFVTKLEYNENGEIINEKRHLDEESFPNINKVNHFTEEDERLFRTDKLDSNGNLIEIKLFSENGELSDKKSYKFDKNSIIKEIKKEDFERNKETLYKFEYGENKLLKRIIKTTNGKTETFGFEYVFY